MDMVNLKVCQQSTSILDGQYSLGPDVLVLSHRSASIVNQQGCRIRAWLN